MAQWTKMNNIPSKDQKPLTLSIEVLINQSGEYLSKTGMKNPTMIPTATPKRLTHPIEMNPGFKTKETELNITVDNKDIATIAGTISSESWVPTTEGMSLK
ncbi:hypothetical protein WICPIJ_006605 [Wickerhamomyces pijperi]|uniref:Uncharacterized protein n=1 Tax=Wickerhamomyces pijperi TaxID=599730 RepID=A0A9P8Q3X4_WICPI|nr:hypothetical protein WICPIJ_006605 [Wickerhamomyces pijperi]